MCFLFITFANTDIRAARRRHTRAIVLARCAGTRTDHVLTLTAVIVAFEFCNYILILFASGNAAGKYS